MGQNSNQDASFLSFVFSRQKSSKNLPFNWEPTVLRIFRKRQQWSCTKRRDIVILEKECFVLYFFSEKLNHYKTYVLWRFLIPDTVTHFRWKNTCNIKFIIFHMRGLITLNFWWNVWKIRTVHKYVMCTGPMDILLRSQGWTQG